MGVVIVEREGTVLEVNVGHPIITSGDGETLFPNYFGRTCLFWRMVCSLMMHLYGTREAEKPWATCKLRFT